MAENADPELPDANHAPRAQDLAPADPPEDAPMGPPTNKKPAVAAPVPAHGEMASQEQLDEGERAIDDDGDAGNGGVDPSELAADAGAGRSGQDVNTRHDRP